IPPLRGQRPRWVNPGFAIAFWLFAVVGVFVMIAAWFWFGLAYFEEQTEQCKAPNAGATMDELGALFGALPLVIVHLISLAILCPIAMKGRRSLRSGAVLAVIAVAVASL